MAQSPQLHLSQSQQLVMTPQLQQAIKLLQMSNIELAEYVTTELETNPLLEKGDEGETGEALQPAETNTALDGAMDFSGSDGGFDEGDNPWAQDSAYLSSAARNTALDEDDFDALDRISDKPSLQEYLHSQIEVDITDPVEKLMAAALVELLDDAGYLPGDLHLVRAQLGADEKIFETVIQKIQSFEPTGIAARGLAECLALQLREKNRLDPAMQKMLDHLDVVARRDISALVKLCGVDAGDVADMIAEIRRLNPKPAAAFTHDVASTLIPDVLLRPIPGGSWHIELNSAALPRVLANEKYYARINGSAKSKQDKTYLTQQWQQANWLVKALAQRAETILKVATEIVARQDAFFVHGVSHLKPMVLREVAAAVEMHESTISRVTTQKYMATPRGVFELKYFFTNALGAGDGAHSAEAVKHRLKQLIEAEEPRKILSDDELAARLSHEGIPIARRTVAKYREAMGIPTSTERKRLKRV